MTDHEGKEKGGAAPVGDAPKGRKAAKSAATYSLLDFILRLHTFARDWAQVCQDLESAEAHLLGGMLDELAEVLKHEYDVRHG